MISATASSGKQLPTPIAPNLYCTTSMVGDGIDLLST